MGGCTRIFGGGVEVGPCSHAPQVEVKEFITRFKNELSKEQKQMIRHAAKFANFHLVQMNIEAKRGGATPIHTALFEFGGGYERGTLTIKF